MRGGGSGGVFWSLFAAARAFRVLGFCGGRIAQAGPAKVDATLEILVAADAEAGEGDVGGRNTELVDGVRSQYRMRLDGKVSDTR